MADFVTLDWRTLISRKIYVMQKFCNFHSEEKQVTFSRKINHKMIQFCTNDQLQFTMNWTAFAVVLDWKFWQNQPMPSLHDDHALETVQHFFTKNYVKLFQRFDEFFTKFCTFFQVLVLPIIVETLTEPGLTICMMDPVVGV